MSISDVVTTFTQIAQSQWRLPRYSNTDKVVSSDILPIMIAHRGNLNGPNKEMENKPEYVMANLDLMMTTSGGQWELKRCVLAEIDVRYIVKEGNEGGIGDDLEGGCKDGEWWLGHDTPDYKVTLDFLKHPLLICHAKNFEAFVRLLKEGIHCFWHQDDDYTLTSNGWLWAYPGKDSSMGIAVMPETAHGTNPKDWSSITRLTRGICTDYVESFLESLPSRTNGFGHVMS